MKILYEDKYCQISEAYIVIYKYYFPLATSKTIMFEDVAKISIEDGSKVNLYWGPSPGHLNNWFHYDAERKKKDRFISIKMKGQKILPSLTPCDVRKVFEILRAHFAELERKSVMFISNRDKETQIAQNQVNEEYMQEIKKQKMIEKPEIVKVESKGNSLQERKEEEEKEEEKREEEEVVVENQTTEELKA